MNRRFMRPLLFAAMVLAGASCSSSGDSPSAEPTPPMAAGRATVPEPPSVVETLAPPSTPTTSVTSIAASAPTSAPTSAVVTTVPAMTSTTGAPTPTFERDFGAVDPIVQAFVDDHGLNGAGLIVVQRDDGIVDEEYWGEFGPDRISLVASSSKMIVAGVLLRLQDEGRLDVDAPVADVVPWGAAHPDITPAQLVSNSSGLVGLLPNPGYAPYVCQFVADGTLQQCAEQIFTTDGDDADVVPPDTEFRYGGAQWQVAGAVAEAASGESWADLVDRIYVQPCGLTSLGFNNHFTQIGDGGFEYPDRFDSDPSVLRDTENPNMEGGAYITARDYATLLQMHLRDGRCGDDQVVSPGALERLHTDRIGPTYDGSAFSDGTGYGMGWWVDRASGRISDPGAYGSVPWLDLEDGYGAFLVIEADSGTGAQLAGELYDVIEAVMHPVDQ
ncbi:MAG: serine hydrolase [Ilumatobacteraceae bacterium]